MIDYKKEKEKERKNKIQLIRKKISYFVKKRKEHFSIAEKNTRTTLIALEVKPDRPRDLVFKIRKSLIGMQDALDQHDKKIEEKKTQKELKQKKRNKKEKISNH